MLQNSLVMHVSMLLHFARRKGAPQSRKPYPSTERGVACVTRRGVPILCPGILRILATPLPSLSVVVHRLGVQRDRNLWSCDDQKGYSPEDQQFFEHISKRNSSLLCHNCPTHLGHKCPTHTIMPHPLSDKCPPH